MAKVAQRIKLYGSFILIGDIAFNEEKNYKTAISASKFKYSSLQFGVKTSDGNLIYIENMGGFSTVKNNVIQTADKDGNKMDIDWKDRFDVGIMSVVPDFKKMKANFVDSDEKNSQLFLTEYDFIEAVKAGISKDLRVAVYGDIKIEKYEDKQGKKQTKVKYTFKKIRLASDTEENKAEATIEFVFDKDCWDEGRLVSDGKVDLSASFMVYDKGTKQNIFTPFQFVVDANALAETSAKRLGREVDDKFKDMILAYVKKQFVADSGVYMQTQWKCDLVRGNLQEEIDESKFNQDQLMQIELGFATVEQIKNQMRGRTGGDKINEIRLSLPTNKYVDEKTEEKMVSIVTDFTEEDFYAKTPQVELAKDVFKDESATGNDDMLKGLFGA